MQKQRNLVLSFDDDHNSIKRSLKQNFSRQHFKLVGKSMPNSIKEMNTASNLNSKRTTKTSRNSYNPNTMSFKLADMHSTPNKHSDQLQSCNQSQIIKDTEKKLEESLTVA